MRALVEPETLDGNFVLIFVVCVSVAEKSEMNVTESPAPQTNSKHDPPSVNQRNVGHDRRRDSKTEVGVDEGEKATTALITCSTWA